MWTLLLSHALAAEATLPSASIDWDKAAFALRITAPPGEHISAEAPVRLDLSVGSSAWLIESDGAWLFARPLDAGLVTKKGLAVQLEGRTFHHQQTNTARVEQVTGELYWRVNKSDTAKMRDYRSAPRTLSCEETANEALWTECLDVPRSEIGRVFGV
jgi:hypothetical protein